MKSYAKWKSQMTKAMKGKVTESNNLFSNPKQTTETSYRDFHFIVPGSFCICSRVWM